ncbi:hypothetical protein OQA88_11880 [Cercophora sp. LCS_1]
MPSSDPLTVPEEDNPKLYSYTPLPTSTSIRLLHLHHTTPLTITLETVDLSNNPTYNALSYTWGNPHPTGVDFTSHFLSVAPTYSAAHRIPILISGHHLHIQQNLHDALTTLPSSPHPLWVDALCINQSSATERAAQVRIMDRIYTNAAMTFIWLGRADSTLIDTGDAFNTIERLARYDTDAFDRSDIIPFRNQAADVYNCVGLEPTTWKEWCAVAGLLKRQWFSRLWIVQESILSPAITVFCGEYSVAWETLVHAMRTVDARCNLLGTRPSTIFIGHDEVAVPLENNVLKLARWRDYWHGDDATNAGRPFTLESLIYDTWTFVATEPRDKIYGVFGLMDGPTRATWVVDYDTPVEEAYAFATRRVLHHAGNLGILSCIQGKEMRKIGERPSWVPDFGVPYMNMMCNSGSFSAAGERTVGEAVCFPSPRWDRLRIFGARVDEIVEVANDRNNYVNSMMLLESSWFELAMLLPHDYHGSSQSRAEVLWRTLCADQDVSGKTPAPGKFGDLFRELLCAMVVVRAELEEEKCADANPPANCAPSFAEAMRWARKRWEDLGWDELRAEELRGRTSSRPRLLAQPEYGWLAFTLLKMQILAKTGAGDAIPDWDSLERFANNPTYVMRVKNGAEKTLVLPNDAGFINSYSLRYGKRKLFITARGYLGLGPSSAKVGDSVCVFRGAGGPFVCMQDPVEGEEETPRFHIVGESYVHGLMHGEAIGLDGVVMKEIEIV